MDLSNLFSLEVKQAKLDPQYFRKRFCGYPDFQDFHLELDRKWESPKRYKLVNIPRNHLKSSWIISRLVWELIHDPNLSILYESAVYTQAVKYCREIANIITAPDFVKAFGNWVGSPWRDNEFTLSTRINKQVAPTLSAGGLDKTQTGQHYDIIVLDDLVTDVNHRTAEGRQKAIDRYVQAVSLLRPSGKIIVIGTPWDRDDLYAWIKNSQRFALFDYVHMSIFKEDGTLLFPEKFCTTMEEEKTSLKRSIQTLQALHSPFEFACQYLCNPEAAEYGEFQRSWFKWKLKGSILQARRADSRVALFCDPALGKENSKSACDTGIVCAVFNPEGVGVFEATGELLTPMATVDRILELHEKYNFTDIFIEAVLFQEVVAEMVEQALAGSDVIIHRCHPKGDKEKRIRALFYFYQRGCITHAADLSGGKLEDQLVRFPKGQLRDVADAFSQFCYEMPDYKLTSAPSPVKESKGIPIRSYSTRRAPKLADRKAKAANDESMCSVSI